MSLDARLQKIFDDHHDAYLVDILGPDNCGLSLDRVRELAEAKLLMRRLPDAVEASLLLGRAVEYAASRKDNDALKRIRQSPLKEARDLLKQVRRLERDDSGSHPGRAVAGAVQLHPEHGHVSAVEPPAPPVKQHIEPPRKPPAALPGPFQELYAQKVQRIVSYCKGLGNFWSEKTQEWIGEKWQGDQPREVPVPAAREKLAKLIRDKVREAVATHRDARKLAREFSILSGDMARNWGRIARTELQAGMTLATIEQTRERYGEEGARVARVPESKACKSCKTLFLGADGAPLVWRIVDLLRNGTNVGLPRTAWKATAYPVHPECLCGTMPVPPGMAIDARGLLRYSR